MVDFDSKKLTSICSKVCQLPPGHDEAIDIGDIWRRIARSAAKVRGFVAGISNRLWVELTYIVFLRTSGRVS